MNRNKKAAGNYAKSLLELAADINVQESFLGQITAFTDAVKSVKNADLIFESPAISNLEKKEIIKKIFSEPHGNSQDHTLMNFLFLLIDKQRISLLPEIQEKLSKLIDENKGVVEAEVFSSMDLDSNTIEQLKKTLEKTLAWDKQAVKKVKIEHKVDPSLLGGIKVKVNDLVYDGSIKGRLENLKRRLK